MGQRITHSTVTVLALLTLGAPRAGPAAAQVGPDPKVYIYGRPGPDRYEYAPPRPVTRPPPPPADDDDWDWSRRPPPPPPFGGYDRPRDRGRAPLDRRRWDDSVCVTSRGTCPTPPAPPDASCGCAIPGFGYTRGRIGD